MNALPPHPCPQQKPLSVAERGRCTREGTSGKAARARVPVGVRQSLPPDGLERPPGRLFPDSALLLLGFLLSPLARLHCWSTDQQTDASARTPLPFSPVLGFETGQSGLPNLATLSTKVPVNRCFLNIY